MRARNAAGAAVPSNPTESSCPASRVSREAVTPHRQATPATRATQATQATTEPPWRS